MVLQALQQNILGNLFAKRNDKISKNTNFVPCKELTNAGDAKEMEYKRSSSEKTADACPKIKRGKVTLVKFVPEVLN